MKNPVRWAARLCLFGAFPVAALAQSATYDFSGAVLPGSSESGSPVAAGTMVTGTVTFDLDAGDPAESIGTPGTSSRFFVESSGNALSTPPDAGALVFSMTANVDGFIYQSTPATAGEFSYASEVFGGLNSYGSAYVAQEDQQSSANGPSSGSLFNLFASAGATTFDSAGFPLAFNQGPASSNEAEFLSSSGNGVGSTMVLFSVDALTPLAMVTTVPEPSTLLTMLAGLMMLGYAARRRHVRAHSAKTIATNPPT